MASHETPAPDRRRWPVRVAGFHKILFGADNAAPSGGPVSCGAAFFRPVIVP